MPKLDLPAIPVTTGSAYPAPHDAAMQGRSQQRLGDAGGLAQFGVNLVRLEPGAMSSLRHWHEQQDEFLVVTEGTLTLVDESGTTELGPGACCAFPAGDPNGHHLVNRSDAPGSFVVVGGRTETETAWYSDLDMKVTVRDGVMRFTRRDGSRLGAIEAHPPEPDFTALSETITRALLTCDATLYASICALPQHVLPRSGEPVRIADRAALDEDLTLYAKALRLNGVTDILRIEKSRTRPAPDRTEIRAEVHLLSRARRIVDPYTVHLTFVWVNGGWKIARVESELGHFNWSRGTAPLPASGRFETKP